jgi:hypothetical protein
VLVSGQDEMWNHRVVRRNGCDGTYYSIHEVYYDSQGNPSSCTENPVEPFGETFEELVQDLQRFTQALEKPILDYDSFVARE